MGDEAFYEFLNDNITLESHPVNYVNDSAVIAQNDNVVSINSTIEMDLTGSRAIEELIELPLMGDPGSLASLDVLTKVAPPAYLTDANLYALVVCRAGNLSL